MSTISLTDNSALNLNETIADDSTLGATPTATLHFLNSQVLGVMDQPLDKVDLATLSIGFTYQPAFTLSGSAGKFTAGGGAAAELDLLKLSKPGGKNPLFPSDQFGTDIEMNGNCYLALGFELSGAAGLNETQGAFLLKTNASAKSSAKLYLPFAPDPAGKFPTLQSAFGKLCAAYTLPSSIADVLKLPAGSVFAYDAQGTVSMSGQWNLLTAVNPTASLGVTTSTGPIKITAGPSLSLGGGISLTGEFQIRLWNKGGNRIQLGYYKKQGATWSVTFDAGASAGVTVGGYDVIAKIYSLLGDSGKLDPAWVKANIPDSVAKDVKTAYEAAVQTKLAIAIDAECDTSTTDQVAFSWEFDTAAIGQEAQDAFTATIHGDLSRLMHTASLPAGVKAAGSVFDRLTTTKHTFQFNFLGLFNYASVQTASLDMNMKASDDGQVVITDKATLSRLSATATPMVKSDLLRKALAEDFVATMGYCASFGRVETQLQLSYTYYQYEHKANRSDLQTFVSIATVLTGSAVPQAEWDPILKLGAHSQSASVLASLAYDNAAATALFLDQTAAVRSANDYAKIARNALALTPGLGLHDTYVASLKDDAKWKTLADAGAVNNFYLALGVSTINPPAWATVAYDWTQHVRVWSSAIHSASQALEDTLQYLKANPTLDPRLDDGFQQRRQTFASQLKRAVQSTSLFDDALGVITIHLAAPPKTENVVIHYGGTTKTYA